MNNPLIFSQFKICPRCGTRSGINAVACLHCRRPYRGQLSDTIALSAGAVGSGAVNRPSYQMSGAMEAPRRTLNVTNFYQLRRSPLGPATMFALLVSALLFGVLALSHNRATLDASAMSTSAPMIYVFADPDTKQYWSMNLNMDNNQIRRYVVISQRRALQQGYHRTDVPPGSLP